ncbi:hypothetical protein ORV05_05025 [Amycolatopsis cynarae]|uniref:Uncharacterized protein n=1 Tax=Amycolatopsis cynarae TaxID=2995223 RepID=A0ABY7B4C3_9PSEU|nr:hypothetical protein [Amycolatopsis sp. HUAS 11-8]WAL67155.1 hypothetical protein ORV05_05025 [Amycolatopsis sp. HUAS 11-8]
MASTYEAMMLALTLNPKPYARYALLGASTVALTANGDTLMQFPSAIQTDPNVTPGGSGNTYFTLTPGTWWISSSVRVSANTSMIQYIATGNTPNESNSLASGSCSNFVAVGASELVEFSTATQVCSMIWSNTAVNAVAYGSPTLGLTHISFLKVS